ncbi:related to SAS10 - involved in silencing [Melanopsichium pennsylvanicum]|uniref:Related to SAS10 - involved in silencing n=2 Tax=Melanopsichium pennsylvanicum TaxID=63383 RepID=A0AAJ4XHH3_9BASI|nr:related to SAS10-involved in silencing [Melanopsichium pennsylvanicum 4]SNX82474.1 related to SAS10 - involved in silencing [Melanopsichium pennsylvanicum]
MAGRRGGSRRQSGRDASGGVSRSAGFDEIPKDDEDHFEASRDQILLDGYGGSNTESDNDFDVGLNNREVLGIDMPPSDDDEDEDSDLDDNAKKEGGEDQGAYDDDEYSARQRRNKDKIAVSSDDDDDLDDDEEEGSEEEMHENDRGWGTNKRAYYNTNDLDAMDSDSEIDEEQARELELKEVKRLQKKSRSTMDDTDFGLGGDDGDAELAKSAKDTGREQRRQELDGDDLVAATLPKKQQQPTANGASAEVTDESSRKALLAKLQQTSPEAVALAGEYADMLEEFGRVDNLVKIMTAEQPSHASLEVMHVHYQTLATYITTMTFYFHLRASPEFANDPAKLRTHAVMQRMMRLKQGLSVMEDLGLTFDPQRMSGANGGLSPDEMDDMHMLSQGSEDDDLGDLDDDELADLMADADSGKEDAAPVKSKKRVKKSKQQLEEEDEYIVEEPKKQKQKADKAKKKAKKPEPVAPLAAELASLDDEPALQVKLKKKSGASGYVNPFAVSSASTNFEDASFGELSGLSSIDSAERAARKRTLQFHASAIESKALQRAKAAKERQSGDADIPYRDRERSRAGVEATKAAKEARLQQQGNGGFGKDTALDGQDGWGEADEKDWRDVMGQAETSSFSSSRHDAGEDEDEDAAGYYDLVTSSRKRARQEAKAEYDEQRNAERFALMEDQELEDGQHRGITRQIEKNKGLTPHRPKTSRNPRVKKRLRYEQAKKKLGSRQAVFKGGQSTLQGGYGGEKSGISTHLVKSRKLG